MHIALVDVLRCPNVHEESWLVASIERMDDREIIEGALGCPICEAEYPVRSGTVHISAADRAEATAVDEETAVRIAALLDLTDARNVALLHGRWASQATLIQSVSPARLMALNGASETDDVRGLSGVVSATAPFASGALHGAVLDDHATPELAASVARALKAGGRLAARHAVSRPADLTLIAEDADWWLAAQSARTSGVVPLSRAKR
jgi:uncharacterized protein YbaR (Trm112 family)